MHITSRRRIVESWLVVVAVSALAIKALDRVPGWVSGTPQGVRVYASVTEAEAALGARVWLPAYYPDSLAWPPSRVAARPGRPASVALRVIGRPSGRERLVIVESIGGTAPPPPELLAPAEVLTESQVAIGGRAAVVARVVIPGGEVVHDVRWDHDERRIVLRYHGPVEELLLIAESLERNAS
jgi:hypothetical protein